MNKLLTLAAALLCSGATMAQQITIEWGDMPAAGDTLRYSLVSPITSVMDLTLTGPNTSWDFGSLVPYAQGVDTYRTAIQAGYPTLSGALGLKVIPGGVNVPIPSGVEDPYMFFQNSSSAFMLRAYGVTFSGFPVPLELDDEDDIYLFPLDFGNSDSSTYRLDFSLLGNTLKQEGYRKTVVDGWGTIITPYTTAPVSCLRVKSYVYEEDTVALQSPPVPITREYVEYKWLAKNEHFPLLQVTATVAGGMETVADIRFRDYYRPSLSVVAPQAPLQLLTAHPNPSATTVTIQLPESWRDYTVELYDMKGRLVFRQLNHPTLDLTALPAGNYMVRVTAGQSVGYVVLGRV